MPNTIASTDVGGTGLSTVGTNGQVLTSNGTTLSWQTPAASTTFSAGTTGFTPNTATSGAVTLGGTLNIANGGTGLTSFTAGQIHYGSFSQSANLFWDSTNNRLGIGTSSPAAKINVTSPAATQTNSFSFDGTTTAMNYGAMTNTGGSLFFAIANSSGTGALNQAVPAYSAIVGNTSNAPLVLTTNSNIVATFNASGAFGVGTSSSYGTAGQQLTSTGSGSAPVWGPLPYTINYLIVAGGGGGAGTNGGGMGGGGAGGMGLVSYITGSAAMYGIGGGGSSNSVQGGWPNGGAGSGGSQYTASTNGTANTGNGGGGSYSTTPGNGGSGIVIISIPTAYYTGTYTGSPTVTTSGSNTILQFTGTGTYTA